MATYTLHINSLTDRQPGESTAKWMTYLATPLDIPNGQGARVALVSAEIPNTAYQFSPGESILWYIKDGTALKSLQIDTARYYEKVNDVVDTLNSELLKGGETDLTFSFDETTKKIHATNAGTGNHSFRIVSDYEFEGKALGQDLYNHANRKLGFTGDLRDAGTVPPFATLTAQSIPRVIRTQCFYLACEEIDNTALTPSPYRHPRILAKIPVSSNFGGVNLYVREQPQFYELVESSIEHFTFTLLDDQLNEIDINGLPITLTLRIQL